MNHRDASRSTDRSKGRISPGSSSSREDIQSQLYVHSGNDPLNRSPSSDAEFTARRSRDRLGVGAGSGANDDYGKPQKMRSRTPTFVRTPVANGPGGGLLAAPNMGMGRSVSWGAINQIGLTPSNDLHYHHQQQRQQQQHQQHGHLDMDEAQRQICKAKAEAKTVSTVNGCLYIDYKFIGQLPPDY